MRDKMVARDARAVPGVIDSFSEGFTQVNRVLWVILLPVLLDLLLWRLPRVSAAPVVDRWAAFYNRILAELGGSGQPAVVPVDARSVEATRKLLGEVNLLSFLASGPYLPWNMAKAWVPAIVPMQQPEGGGVVEVSGLLPLLGLVVAFQLLGLLLGCTYLGVIGQQVRDGQVEPLRLGRRVWRYWLNTLGFVGIVLGVLVALVVPLSLVVGVLALVAPVLAMGVLATLMIAAVFVEFWMLVYLFFLVDAIVVGELGPIAAARSSVLVVRDNLGASLGLIGLTLLITVGMQVIWDTMARQTWGLLLAIVGSAYVSSGLLAASMLFYRNRRGLKVAVAVPPFPVGKGG